MVSVNNNLPPAWQNDDIVEGLDTIDKSQLIDVPFRILGCTFSNNDKGVNTCFIDAERVDGTQFTFTDSSTGVRAQVVAYLTDKSMDHVVESGEYAEFRLIAPRGLRVSNYEREVRGANGQIIPGRTAPARTYYLTTNGERGARSKSKPSAAPVAKRAQTAK